MTAAQTLAVVHSLLDNMKVVMDGESESESLTRAGPKQALKCSVTSLMVPDRCRITRALYNNPVIQGYNDDIDRMLIQETLFCSADASGCSPTRGHHG
jgi:hypothetical protein